MKRIIALLLALLLFPGFAMHTSGETEKRDYSLVINELAFNTTDPKAVWFEIYNPTRNGILLKDWEYTFTHVYCVFSFPPVELKPGGYLVITPSVENFTRYWRVNISNVYQGTVLIHAGNLEIFEKNGTHKDIADIEERYLPLNWSWARYRDLPYTGNFTQDFYVEPHPTPGKPNNQEKVIPYALWKIAGYLTLGILVISIMVLIPYLVARRIRKKRGVV